MNDTDTQAVIDTAIRAADPTPLDSEQIGDARFFAVNVPAGGTCDVIDLEVHRDHLRDRPRRKKGIYKVHDADSFVAYLKKHGDSGSEIWADTTTSTVTGVINAHEDSNATDEPLGTLGDDDARWEDHRVVYGVLLTDAWKAWAELDGKLLEQEAFAEHIENRSIDIVTPSGADMLEVAQHFHATTGVTFQSAKALSSGERQLVYREQIDATSGKNGQMAIPSVFVLGLQPFEGSDGFKITARLRYRITHGQLRIGYQLERPADALRAAFLSVVESIDEATDQTVLRGSR